MEALVGLFTLPVVLPVLLLASGLLVYAWFVEPTRLQLSLHRVKLEAIPAGLNGLRIAHLSDCHGRHCVAGKELDEWVEQAQPDVVVITGDLLDPADSREAAQGVLAAVSRIAARWPVFYVTGNHEHQFDLPVRATGTHTAHELFGSLQQLIIALRQRGVTVLLDEHVTVCRGTARGGVAFSLVGVRDPALGYARLQKALETEGPGEPQELLRPVVLLAHSPDIIAEAAQAGVDVVLAGHTHGGQVRLPLVGALVTRTRVGRQFASGLHRVGRTHVFVSRGIGTTSLPIRFICPPELAIVELRASDSPAGASNA